MADDTIRAVVQKIYPKGRHGPFAVAISEGTTPVNLTFSLGKKVWKERSMPEAGTVVMLSQISMKRNGWRANLGRFLKPSDEQNTARSNEP